MLICHIHLIISIYACFSSGNKILKKESLSPCMLVVTEDASGVETPSAPLPLTVQKVKLNVECRKGDQMETKAIYCW